MSFGAYMIGFAVMIVGLVIAAYLLNVPPKWIGAGVVTLIGIGIISGVTRTRQRDPNS